MPRTAAGRFDRPTRDPFFPAVTRVNRGRCCTLPRCAGAPRERGAPCLPLTTTGTWHRVLWPRKAGDLSKFVLWISSTRVRRRREHRANVGEGHLFQGLP